MADRPEHGAETGPSGLVTGLTEKLIELETAAMRQAQRLSAVLDIGTALSSVRDIDALLQLVIDRIKTLLRADAATLFMLDAKRSELWSRVMVGPTLKEIRLPMRTGVAGHVVEHGETLLLRDAYEDPRFHPEIDRVSGFRTRSVIAAPLRHQSGRILGVMEVLHHEVNVFTPDDRSLVDAVSAQIASVLENVLLYEELRQQNAELLRTEQHLSEALQELDLLFEVERSISSTEQLEDLLGQILHMAGGVLGVGAAAILLVEDDRGSLFFRQAGESKETPLRTRRVHPGEGVVGQVASTGRPVRIERAEGAKPLEPALAQDLGLEVESLLCVPIPMEDRVVGALALMNKPEGFSAADERLAMLLAGQTGRAIMLRRTREEGERRARLAAIGQMLSGVLHDFRTPMTIISGYCQMLAEATDPRERTRQAAVVEQQLEQLNAMMTETLAFARGDREVLLRKVYFQKFMAEVSEYLEHEFANTRIQLKVSAEYNGPARVDDGKLKRVIYNIARNAIQAMPQGGTFSVSVRREQDELVMRFDDDGPGIPPEIAGRLFGSFVTAGKPGGTGLGLAIVKKVIEEHGGWVRCSSEPGKGAHFEARVPVGLQDEGERGVVIPPR